MSLIGSSSFGFAQDMIRDFQNTVLNSTNATKIVTKKKGENAGHQHFPLFQQCFQKPFPSGLVNPLLNKYILILTYQQQIAFKKKLWEKEKLLVTSNFSFSHNVFYPIR